MSALGAKLLSRFVRPLEENASSSTENIDVAKVTLQQLLPGVDQMVRDKVVLDFGSGEGWHALAFGEWKARTVFGIEIDPAKVERSRQRARDLQLTECVFFETSVPEICLNACDLILSRDSMEHYENPEDILLSMKRCLRPGGLLVI